MEGDDAPPVPLRETPWRARGVTGELKSLRPRCEDAGALRAEERRSPIDLGATADLDDLGAYDARGARTAGDERRDEELIRGALLRPLDMRGETERGAMPRDPREIPLDARAPPEDMRADPPTEPRPPRPPPPRPPRPSWASATVATKKMTRKAERPSALQRRALGWSVLISAARESDSRATFGGEPIMAYLPSLCPSIGRVEDASGTRSALVRG